MKFIEVVESIDKTTLLLNIDNISVIWKESNTIMMSGNHKQGDGLFFFDKENFNKIINGVKKYGTKN